MIANPITRQDLSPNRYIGGFRDVKHIAIHTQQGRGKARDIIPYLKSPASEVSYNAVVDDVESVLVVPWQDSPWSAMNANRRADHILAAGTFAEWSRGKWLETDASDGVNEDQMLTRVAVLTAWRCQVRGLPIEYVGNYGRGPYPPTKPGICGHMDFGAWGGGHTDPGPNYPWDELIRRARIAGGIIMALTIEQEIRLQLTGSPDLGKYPGWKQLGDRSLVDALAAACEKLGVSGCYDPKNKK